MDTLIDIFSSWEGFFSFLLALIIFFGGMWVIAKIINAEKQEEDPSSSTENLIKPVETSISQTTYKPIITRVAGVTFDNRQNTIRHLKIGDTLELRREPENPYDPKAIMVLTQSNELIGYIPSTILVNVQWFFEVSEIPPFTIVQKIVEVENAPNTLGVVIEISPPSEDEIWLSNFHKYPPF